MRQHTMAWIPFVWATLGSVMLGTPVFGQTIIYVNGSYTGESDGESWRTPYQDLHDALAVAKQGDQIWIARGVYHPALPDPSDFGELETRNIHYSITDGIQLYGGFYGGETSPDDRDVASNPTILSGDLADDDEPDFVNTIENSYNVIWIEVEETALTGGPVLLDGLTIQGGNASSDLDDGFSRGAGIHLELGDLTIRNCEIVGNLAMNRGGGLWINEGSLAVIDCRFSGNSALRGGAIGQGIEASDEDALAPGFVSLLDCEFHQNAGAVYLEAINATFESSRFDNNAANLEGYNGPGISIRNNGASILNCSFVENTFGSGLSIFDSFESTIDVENCSFRANSAGLGIAGNGAATIRQCEFIDHVQDGNGTGLSMRGDLTVEITDCSFRGNSGAVGSAIRASGGIDLTVNRCEFRDNSSQFIGGGISVFSENALLITNCTFIHNTTGWWGGGVFVVGNATISNCAFSQNSADLTGGGVYAFSDETTYLVELINCSFSDNCGSGVTGRDADVRISNSILWGNSPEQVFDDLSNDVPPPPSASTSSFVINDSDIQGGWAGAGSNNIGDDPLFVQPSTHDLRLSFGSPCVDVGDNSAVPSGVVFDLAGQPRIINGTVDIGAYEGEYAPLPPEDSADGLDPGEAAILGDTGCVLESADFLSTAIVFFQNTSGVYDAIVSMNEFADSSHSSAGGFSELGSIVSVSTSLADSEFKMLITIPFELDDLGGEEWFDLDLTFYDPALDDWTLGVEANVQLSPGHEEVVGNRFVTSRVQFTPSQVLGDHGVHWDPQSQSGLVWAQLDHAGEFGLGDALCYGDIAPETTTDDTVNVDDLFALLSAWGDVGGPADISPDGGDGSVNVNDLLRLLANWGACPQ